MFMGIFMAFTAGYFSSLVMMYAPKWVIFLLIFFDKLKIKVKKFLKNFFF